MSVACPFSRIVRGELPAEVIYQDEAVVVFLDARPLSAGHSLVVPREHVERLEDLCDHLCQHLLVAGRKVARAAREGLGAAGVNVGLNDGAIAGQAVPHLHLHVVPRFPGDGGRSFHAVLPARWSVELAPVAQRLRDAIAAA
ncbi:MAG: HIT family protein [Candidatus Bipolaricaulaceae bacterium]